MPDKLTTQEKAQVFSLYLGWPIISGNGKFLKLDGACLYGELHCIDEREAATILEISDKPKLVLKPLGSISQKDYEHLIGLNRAQFEQPKFKSWKDYKDALLVAAAEEVHNILFDYQEADYLRSRGYALPYKGHDLFDAGLAITKHELPND